MDKDDKNNNKLLKNLNCIAFDMDMTLVRYNNHNVAQLIFDCLLEYLEPIYPGLSKFTKLDLNFCRRGLVIDMDTGYFLKLDSGKRVTFAYDAMTEVSRDKIDEIYHKVPISNPESPFHLFDGNHTPRFISMITFFEIPMASIWLGYLLFQRASSDGANTVDLGTELKKFAGNIVKGYDTHFNDFYGGVYYKRFKENPGNYVYKVADEFVQWLKEMKSKGCKLLLITNSKSEYTDYLMTWSYGENYLDLFDLFITDAHKPDFFKSDKPFINLKTFYPESDLNLEDLKCKEIEFNKGYAYKGGNVNLIIEKIKKDYCSGNEMVNFCYVGDNLMGDVVAPKKYVNWLTVAIVEELMDPEEILILQEHTTTTITKHSSSQWGSYFVTLFESKIVKSFWTSVIREHADIVLSSVDQLAKYHQQVNQTRDDEHPLLGNIIYG